MSGTARAVFSCKIFVGAFNLSIVLLLVFLGSTRVLACACCTDVGQRYVEKEKLDARSREILDHLGFVGDANLFVGEGGLDEVVGIKPPSDTYALQVVKGERRWKFKFVWADQQTGTISFPIPVSFTSFEVDTRETQKSASGPVLYKEWRLTSPLQGTGMFDRSSTDARSVTLIFHGRGNNCTEASDFSAWTMVLHGGSATNTLFGSLLREPSEVQEKIED